MESLTPEDPQRVGAYRLLGRLGEGGMGRVYLARSEHGRTVAVKVVRPELAAREDFRGRFRQEVQAARRVGGEWTAPVLDADTEAVAPWVATGYVAGPSLDTVVGRDHGPLPERSVVVLANRLARALQAIHGAGLIHRDLKPSNILLTLDGPRVIDFGIARALDASTESGLTAAGLVVGSPGFMSPEQVRGERVTPAGDVFCVGAVLAYAATGRSPFGVSTSGAPALMFRIAHEQPDLEGMPPALRQLASDCLVKEARERPSVEVLVARTDALEAAADGQAGEPWLPAALVAQLGRHAVRLLDTETPRGVDPRNGEPVGAVPVGGAPVGNRVGNSADGLDLRTAALARAAATPPAGPVTPPVPGRVPGPVPGPAATPAPAPAAGAGPAAAPGPKAGWRPPSAASPAPAGRVPRARSAPPPSSGTVPRPRTRRRAVPLAAAVVVTLLIAGGATFALVRGGHKGSSGNNGGGHGNAGAQGGVPDTADSRSGTVPPAYIGTWTGTVDRDGDGIGSQRRLVITAGGVGEVVVKSFSVGESYQCEGVGKLLSGRPTVLKFDTKVTKSVPKGKCSENGDQTLKLNADATLAWTAGNGRVATLRKAAGSERIPEKFLGTWKRSLSNGFTQKVTIEQGPVGSPVVTFVADSGKKHCVAKAELFSADDTLVVGPSVVTAAEPPGGCEAGGSSSFTVAGKELRRVFLGNDKSPRTYVRGDR